MAELQQSNPDKKGRSKTRRRLHMDMTPMVDLAFLLLTFFVMTSELTKPFVLKLQMPEESAVGAPINARKVLTLILGEGNKIYWYNGENPQVKLTSFSADGIRKLLFEKKGQINKMYVLIKASDKSKYKNVIDILDEMAITEITRYSIVNMEDVDKRLIAESKL